MLVTLEIRSSLILKISCIFKIAQNKISSKVENLQNYAHEINTFNFNNSFMN